MPVTARMRITSRPIRDMVCQRLQ
ncbi:hypothetical protein PENSOL_c108G09104 [Penicillium solitum]|uniref:Uncharacterized protein n=1 Tax=Penicillium solitum TaxID=60172 RepID=A0A1V6Q829_9EURO|nr:hypothetical protein PENSOL_c108G09104 [Penicillium solitum]